MTDWQPRDILDRQGRWIAIVDVRPTGYGWRYLFKPAGGMENYFWSENSTDPKLEDQWVKIGRAWSLDDPPDNEEISFEAAPVKKASGE